jgi:hypothetical protein
MKNGQGTMTYGDKSVYCGSWLNDKRNGEGTMTVKAKEGDYVYSGEWLDDLKHGGGKYTWPNTDVYYLGDWVSDKR